MLDITSPHTFLRDNPFAQDIVDILPPPADVPSRGMQRSAREEFGLRVDGVSHAYDSVPVVRDVSLTVAAGEITCLLGPSGCGKTTLLRLVAGLERLQHGRIAVGGRIVADADAGEHAPPEHRPVGLMFQDFALFPHLNVLDNVCFGVRKTARHRQWAHAAIERMGLANLEGAYPHTLSGGQQQRCALLRALAPEPEVLLLDEPFSGLDVTRRAQVRDETAALLRQAGVAALVVTHDPEEAMGLADRLLVMHSGKIVQRGTPSEIYLTPRNPFIASLFGPLNRWTGIVQQEYVETPIGRAAAGGLTDGTAAVVLIRPEGIIVSSNGEGVPARVLSARLLGRCNDVRLEVAGCTEPLQASGAGIFLPVPGTPLTVSADPRHTFVFPLE